jgi:hypothetical protein
MELEKRMYYVSLSGDLVLENAWNLSQDDEKMYCLVVCKENSVLLLDL